LPETLHRRLQRGRFVELSRPRHFVFQSFESLHAITLTLCSERYKMSMLGIAAP
jgi:hypothetical protein